MDIERIFTDRLNSIEKGTIIIHNSVMYPVKVKKQKNGKFITWQNRTKNIFINEIDLLDYLYMNIFSFSWGKMWIE